MATVCVKGLRVCVGASTLQLGLIESEMHSAAESASAGADVDLDEDDDEAIENILQTATTTGIILVTIRYATKGGAIIVIGGTMSPNTRE